MLNAWLWSLLVTFGLSVPVITVYLHRTITHRALTLHPRVDWVFRFLNWITMGVDPAMWAAIHRKHHAYADVDLAADRRDPHSPRLEGYWRIQIGNVWYFFAEMRNHPGTLDTFARDLLNSRDWWDRHVFRRSVLGPLVGLSFLWIILGGQSWLNHKSLSEAVRHGIWFGSMAGGFHAITLVFLLNPFINALCHWPHRRLGAYQNSRAAHALGTFNNWVVALLTAGEGFHNNHHDQLATARLAWTPWESIADWGYWAVIVPLRWLGLATNVRLPKPVPR